MDQQNEQNKQNETVTPGQPASKRNPALVAITLVAVLAVAFFLWTRISEFMVPDVPGVVLNDMRSIQDLRTRFNQDQGTPRLILLLSPT
jgi:hypothetical protein